MRLNTETSLFSSLIPVDVKEDSLVHYVEREESAKAKSALITRPKMPEVRTVRTVVRGRSRVVSTVCQTPKSIV